MKVLYSLYYWLLAIPIFILASIVCALIVIFSTAIGCRSGGYYPVMWWGRFACFIFMQKVRIEGLENIEKGRSYIFASNHQSAMDVFLIYGYLGIPFSWIMKHELRRIPLIGRACEVVGHIFIDRTNVHSIADSLAKAKQQLSNGGSIVIFPEGSRSRTGKVSSFKRGGFQLAIDLQLPIIPTILDGAYKAMPRDSYYITPQQLILRFMPAIETVGLESEDMSELKKKTQEVIETELEKIRKNN